MTANERLVDKLLYHDGSPALLAAFFDPAGPFEGGLLESLPGNDPLAITIQDLLAVTMLDVAVAPRGVRRLLFEPATTASVTNLLSAIPTDVDIWDGWEHIRPDSAALQLLKLLPKQGDGIGDVTASKILARKRPRLIPVVDSVVLAILDVEPSRSLFAIHEYLQPSQRRERLSELRRNSTDPTTPLLRILDALMWTWGSQARDSRKARRAAGLPVPGWTAL